MGLGISKWPAWTVVLGISIVGGGLCVVFNIVIPALGLHGSPNWLGEVRIMAPLTVLFAAVMYAGLVDHAPMARVASGC